MEFTIFGKNTSIFEGQKGGLGLNVFKFVATLRGSAEKIIDNTAEFVFGSNEDSELFKPLNWSGFEKRYGPLKREVDPRFAKLSKVIGGVVDGMNHGDVIRCVVSYDDPSKDSTQDNS